MRAHRAQLPSMREHRMPKLTSVAIRRSKRRNRIFLDCGRNSFGQTAATPYSLRAFAKATVSTPLDWQELTANCSPARYNLRSMMRRIKVKGDPWQAAMRGPNSLRKLESSLRAIALSAIGSGRGRHAKT
jgi:bifunctional non-homologous end joining protein LigD